MGLKVRHYTVREMFSPNQAVNLEGEKIKTEKTSVLAKRCTGILILEGKVENAIKGKMITCQLCNFCVYYNNITVHYTCPDPKLNLNLCTSFKFHNKRF